jgi:DNA-binding Xre family transcriptional regulator
MNRKHPHIGSDFDAFLAEEGILSEVEIAAAKRVIAFQLQQAMAQEQLSKSALADKMHTSRTAVDRLLDPDNLSVTLQTLGRAAQAFGKRLHIELV